MLILILRLVSGGSLNLRHQRDYLSNMEDSNARAQSLPRVEPSHLTVSKPPSSHVVSMSRLSPQRNEGPL